MVLALTTNNLLTNEATDLAYFTCSAKQQPQKIIHEVNHQCLPPQITVYIVAGNKIYLMFVDLHGCSP